MQQEEFKVGLLVTPNQDDPFVIKILQSHLPQFRGEIGEVLSLAYGADKANWRVWWPHLNDTRTWGACYLCKL